MEKCCLKYLKGDLSLLSPSGQKKVIENCFPKESIPADWTCEENDFSKNIQSLLTKSGTKFDHIESTEKYLWNFDWTISFPGSHAYYGLDAVEHFRPWLIFYDCDGERYQYKKDMYRTLGTSINSGTLSEKSERFGLSLLFAFLNTKEKGLPISSELYHAPNDLHDKVSCGMVVVHKMITNNGWKSLVPQEIDFSNHEAALKSYHGLVVEEEDEEVVCPQISERLKKFSDEFPFETNSSEYQKIYVWVSLILKLFKKFVYDNPLIALPRSETVDTIRREKVPIRVLKAHGDEFIIAHELLHILKTEKLDVSGIEEKILALPRHAVLNPEIITEFIPPELLKKIDFVTVATTITIFNSTLIPTFEGRYAMLSFDFLRNTLLDLVDTNKIFHGMRSDQQGIVEDVFSDIERFVGNEAIYVDDKDAEAFNAKIQKWYKTNFPSGSQLEIRKTNRFTLKDLRNELKHLKLLEIFPDILDHAGRVYHAKAFKNGWEFTTSYMHELIWNCQLMSMSCKFPKFSRFLHRNQFCTVIYECPICKGTLDLDEPTVECEEQREPEELWDAPSSLESPTEVTLERSESSSLVEEASENVTKEKPKKKKLKIKVDVRESHTCPKCFRASQFTRGLTEKVRLVKVETKALKKQAKELDTTVGELESRVEQLKTETEADKQRELEMLAKIEMLQQQLVAAKLGHSEKIGIVEAESEKQHPVVGREATAETQREKEEEKEHVLSEAEVEKQQAVVVAVALTEDKKKEKIKAEVLSKFEKIGMTIQMENPLGKIEELTIEAYNKTNYKRAKQFLKQEKELFSKSCQAYIETLRSNIEMIHKDEFDLTTLPEFPSLSKKFVDVYKRVMQCDPPVICESLLKKPDDGLEANAYAVPVENTETDLRDCLICFADLTPEDDLLQCWKCKRHCHKNGLMEWFKVKRTCPLCSAAILDEDEYPALS